MISDVFRDLRDRHLLVPAVALLVALVAIPILLKSSAEELPPIAAVAPSSAKASPVSSAVLAGNQVSVRNYRKRLEDLKSKNPFKQQFAEPIGVDEAATDGTDAGAEVVDAGTAAPTGTAEPTGAAPTEVVESGPGDVVVEEQVVDEDGNAEDGTGDDGADGEEAGADDPKPADVETVTSLFTRRVNLQVGAGGPMLQLKNVKPMTILPEESTPVAAFLGTDEGGKRAAFVVAKDATVAGGTAACVPSPENCLYVTLKVGETALFQLADGQQFELRLQKILDVEI